MPKKRMHMAPEQLGAAPGADRAPSDGGGAVSQRGHLKVEAAISSAFVLFAWAAVANSQGFPARPIVLYQLNGPDIVFDFSKKRVTVAGEGATLADCSDASTWCFRSELFSFVGPRRCKDLSVAETWQREGVSTKIIYHHTGLGLHGSSGEEYLFVSDRQPNVMFRYDPWRGITNIVRAPATVSMEALLTSGNFAQFGWYDGDNHGRTKWYSREQFAACSSD